MRFSISLPSRALLVVPIAALLLLMGTAGSAHASASVFDFQFTNVFGPDPADPGSFDSCRGMPITTLGGTELISVHDVLSPIGAIHEHGSIDGSYRADFADGSYVLSSGSSNWNYNFRLDTPAEVNKTTGGVSRATIYDADGNVIGTEWMHEVSHVSRIGLFDPDAATDTLHVRFDKARLTCSP